MSPGSWFAAACTAACVLLVREGAFVPAGAALFVLAALSWFGRAREPFGSALLRCAAFAAACTITLEVVQRAMLWLPDLDVLWNLVVPLRVLGCDFGIGESGALSVPGYDGRLQFHATPDRAGVALALAWLAGLWASAEPRVWTARTVVAVWSSVLLTVLARLAVTTAWLAGTGDLFVTPGTSWLAMVTSVWVDIGMCAVMALLASRSVSAGLEGAAAAPPRALPRLAVPAACVLGYCAAVLGVPQTPAVQNTGRVLVDDRAAGFWNPASRRMSTGWYGDFSTYNFNLAVRLLAGSWPVTVNTREKYTRELLADYDILVIKTPVVDLEATEISAIRLFVLEGGGLLAIGDHTNLLGMSARLNDLLSGSGISFNFDAVNDGRTGALPSWTATAWRRHPIAAGIESLSVLTPCSLTLRGRARPVLTLSHQETTAGDYGSNSYFGTMRSDPRQRYGDMVLCAEAPLGRGHVVALADSTSLSSFHLSEPGWRQLLGNCCRFLAGSSHGWFAVLRDAVFWLLAIALAGLGVVAAGRSAQRRALVLSTAVGIAAGIASGNGLDAAEATPVVRRGDLVVCEQGVGSMVAPVLGFIGKPEWDRHRYESFVAGLMRMGLEPVRVRSIEEAAVGDSMVVISPVLPLEARGRSRLDQFLRDGGHLYVLVDSEHCAPRAVASYVELCGLTVSAASSGVEVSDDGSHEAIDALVKNGVHATSWAVGKGVITLVVGCEKWSLEGLGHAFTMPSHRQRENYTLLYSVFMNEVVKRSGLPNYRVL